MKNLLLLISLALPVTAQSNLDPPATAVAGITAERMRAHMSFLADDLLEGRGTGTRGHEIAARYVQTQFELLGLKPAGVNGYRQQVPFRSIAVVPEQSSVVMKRNGKSTPLKIYEDVLLGGNETSTDVSVEARRFSSVTASALLICITTTTPTPTCAARSPSSCTARRLAFPAVSAPISATAG